MVDLQSSFDHHFFKISGAERIPKRPTHTQEHDLRLEMTPFEGVLALLRSWKDLFSPPVPNQLFLCNTTLPCTSGGPHWHRHTDLLLIFDTPV